jgi:hypothetical protein
MLSISLAWPGQGCICVSTPPPLNKWQSHDLITPLKISLILPFKAIPEISNPSTWLYAPALVCAGVVLSIRRWYNYSREGIVYVCTIFFTFNVISTYLPLSASFLPTHRTQCRATLQHPIPTQALHISHVSIAYPFKMVSRRLQTYPALENVQK